MTYRPPAREGISPRKVVLQAVVPADTEYFAAAAGDSPFSPGQLLPAGMALSRPVPAWYHPDVPEEKPIPFDYTVLYEDRDLIVVDKPHFLPTTSNGRLVRETLQTRLRVDFGEDDIVPLHRLDRLTAGVVVCSRNPRTRGRYQRLFAERKVTKTYHARLSACLEYSGTVELSMHKVKGSRQVSLGGTPTLTQVEAHGYTASLIPHTGHTHQLRVVCNYLGAPIQGDDTYPIDRGLDLYDFSSPLQLVAHRLEFADPLSGTRREFSTLRQLGGNLI